MGRIANGMVVSTDLFAMAYDANDKTRREQRDKRDYCADQRTAPAFAGTLLPPIVEEDAGPEYIAVANLRRDVLASARLNEEERIAKGHENAKNVK
ncbi:MAG TPA: hypothetical protein VHE58_10335 [Burkholderiales bacterium]|nr:hypothetical protein [Burkholderiales bacterium]